MPTTDWSKLWGAYTPAVEAWQAFVVNSMMGFGRASMMWMMVPLNIGDKMQSQTTEGGAGQLTSLLQHAADARKQAESYATRAYASSLDAGYRSFREFEAVALDGGTFDGDIRQATEDAGKPRRAA